MQAAISLRTRVESENPAEWAATTASHKRASDIEMGIEAFSRGLIGQVPGQPIDDRGCESRAGTFTGDSKFLGSWKGKAVASDRKANTSSASPTSEHQGKVRQRSLFQHPNPPPKTLGMAVMTSRWFFCHTDWYIPCAPLLTPSSLVLRSGGRQTGGGLDYQSSSLFLERLNSISEWMDGRHHHR